MAKRKFWTEDEEEFLTNHWHEKGFAYCAKKLNRSRESVLSKAYFLGLSGCVRGSGYLTSSDIARLMGIYKNAVLKWLNAGLIKHKLAPIKQKTYLVKVNDLENFLKNNQDLWDSRNLKTTIWRNKPDWLKEKMQKDRLCPLRMKRSKKWSELEEQTLLAMVESGNYTYKQMGEVLKKHPKAVESKLRNLRSTKTGR